MMLGESDGVLPCKRCRRDVPAILPWPGWQVARYGWYATIGVMLFAFPVMAADYCVMIPTMMGIILAGSTVHAYAKQKPVCKLCSLELDFPKR